MVLEPSVETTLLPEDLHRASALDSLTQAIGAQEAIEYWKSAPYLLNFMKGYKLKEQFKDRVESNIDISGPLDQSALSCPTSLAHRAGGSRGSGSVLGMSPQATRKPISRCLSSGSGPARLAQRRYSSVVEWLPPRVTLKSPSA